MNNRILLVLMLATMGLTGSLAFAAGGTVEGPNVIAPDRYVYYPGTEELAKDEIRLIACGTGLPAARCPPRSGGDLLAGRTR